MIFFTKSVPVKSFKENIKLRLWFVVFSFVFSSILLNMNIYICSASTSDIPTQSNLHAKYCALIDGDNGRLLFGKDSDVEAPMASTTKIMTCLVALQANPQDYIATVSPYAASMPDVQLNAVKGQQFHLNDLLYSLMLKSHNDTAVIIAENYAFHYLCTHPEFLSSMYSSEESNMPYDFLTDDILASDDSSILSTFTAAESKALVHIFARIMNEKASEFGCSHTYYITPNGLDSTDETGEHHTTAYELALIMSKCIENPEFNKVCQTKSYSFSDISGKSNYSVGNANAFLNMYDHIIAGKTGFTGNAGYCYVCAYRADGRTFIVALLACGWPSNKTYKWKDARLLLNYAREHYLPKEILSPSILTKEITVQDGKSSTIQAEVCYSYTCLLSDSDQINVVYKIPETIRAPIKSGQPVGTVTIYINELSIQEYPVICCTSVDKISFMDSFSDVLTRFLPL